MTTRAEASIFKPKIFNLTSTQFPCELPIFMAVVLQVPKRKRAMGEEDEALIHNGTWELVPKTTNISLVGRKWIFLDKIKP